jgi:hypothetical protein
MEYLHLSPVHSVPKKQSSHKNLGQIMKARKSLMIAYKVQHFCKCNSELFNDGHMGQSIKNEAIQSDKCKIFIYYELNF